MLVRKSKLRSNPYAIGIVHVQHSNRCTTSWCEADDVGTLEGKVLGPITVLYRNNVLHVEGVDVIVFVELAVFAALGSTLASKRTRFVIHYELELLATIFLAFALRRAKILPT